MIASVHITDVGVRRSLPALARRTPGASTVPGLRQAQLGVAAVLGNGLRKPPQFGRLTLIAFWDDDEALDRFEAESPLAARLAGGFHARLEPLRAHGTWPGLPVDLPKSRNTAYEGPSVVLTLGRLRVRQARPFLKASHEAEVSATRAPGLIWGTALAKPPFVSTCSLWESTGALSSYAYGDADPGHPDAIRSDRSHGGFHHEMAFIRFRPYAIGGHLEGTNPLPEAALTT